MGSGMGIPYALSDAPLDLPFLADCAAEMIGNFRRRFPRTRIIIEVGRYAVCKSGVYVTQVLDRKLSCGKTYLILKNTLNGFIRPSLAKLVEKFVRDSEPAAAEPLFTETDAFQLIPLREGEAPECVTLVGNLCTAADVIAENVMLPHLECGDSIVITNAGAYAAALSPVQFSSQEPPAELFLTVDGRFLEA